MAALPPGNFEAEFHPEDNDDDENVLTLQTVRDNIVSGNTQRIYTSDLSHFLKWIQENENEWLTEYGNQRITEIVVRQEGENNRRYKSRMTTQFSALLRLAPTNPIVDVNQIQVPRFLEYVFSLRPSRGGGIFLSKSAYGNKRASLNHLFRLHNMCGYPEAFKQELSNLYKGLYHQLARHRRDHVDNDEDVNHEGGRLNMSTILYRRLAKLFLDMGTDEGVFAHTFLILSWNLACRCNNTAKIKLVDISWNIFDAFTICFSTSKMDQMGDASKYERHLYANPFQPEICPVLSLGMYFTACFGNVNAIPINSFLFPGENQDARFSNILKRTVNENWDEIARMGYSDHRELGTHSVRKGAVSYLHSIGNGPPEGAISLRAGWTMGKVKDIYVKYVASGDQLVGRCISLLSPIRDDFGASPPMFENNEQQWIDETRQGQFRQIANVNGYMRLTEMLLASIIHHRQWLMVNLEANHVFLQSSMVSLNHRLVFENATVVRFPWNDNVNSYTGIPANTAIMQALAQVRLEQNGLGIVVEEGTRRALREEGIAAGVATPAMLAALENSIRDMLDNFNNNGNNNNNNNNAQAEMDDENDNGMVLHEYLDSYHRVPQDWRFPRNSVHDLWRQWWIGDRFRNVWPLRHVRIQDIRHLDNIPIGDNERHGRRGRNANLRRPTSKILSDMRFLMNHVHRTVVSRNLYEENKTIESVDRMFAGVADVYNFSNNPRNGQLNWITTVAQLRKRG